MGDAVDQAFEHGFVTDQAHEKYTKLHFVNPDTWYDHAAPDVQITLMIGGFFALIMIIMWGLRYLEIKQKTPTHKMTYWMSVRIMITAAIDSDDPVYTIIKICAQSILFLAFIQIDYRTAFIAMLAFFTFESCLDTVRTLLCVYEYKDHRELYSTSSRMRQDINNDDDEDDDSDAKQLHPTNVYEDLTRVSYVVIMVFITQTLLITFVVIDIMNSSTHSCPDGTAGCPVGGTLGSWCFYCLGIFMAGVVLLGPKTNFGDSEQNPAYWMQLFLYLKGGKGQVTWTDAKTGKKEKRFLRESDWRIWGRFWMSFIINGIGFRILVFALPIQIAAQSSLTGVVFRAVGMLYLVDLDDSPGYTLTFNAKEAVDKLAADDDEPSESTGLLKNNKDALSKEAKAIIKEARDKLDALAASSGL